MIYYGNPCSAAVRDAMSSGQLGCITTPRQGNALLPQWDVMADNGCFSGAWMEKEWMRWVSRMPRSIRFAVAPDVVDPSGRPTHHETMDLWQLYGGWLDRQGFAAAFVCQVGSTSENVPDAPVLFLGGTTEWKLGKEARAIAAAAQRRGQWVHMGRVNSYKRLQIAHSMGCDSADGTYLKYGPDKNLPNVLRWLSDIEKNDQMVYPDTLFSLYGNGDGGES